MKKNTMMRIASALMIAVLLTTCVISGTFAKYTTENGAGDTARVAKWGVVITTESDLFAETYATTDTTVEDDTITNSVAVDSAGTNLVAPGTNGSIDFSIAGAPEVAVRLDVVMNVTSDVIIPSGTEIADGNTLAADYTPVVFTLTKTGEATPLATGTLSAIQTKLQSLTDEFGPNSATLAGEYTLAWAWAYTGNDAADTYLGNVIAGTVTDANTKTAIDFDFTITVTQID